MLKLLFFLNLCSFAAFAEDRTEIFEKIKAPGLIETQVSFPTYSFYLGAPNVNGQAYVPNYRPQVGLAMAWKNFSIATDVASIPLPEVENERRGKSDQFNFIFNKHWRDSALDVYYQFYRSFYLASPWSEFDSNKPRKYPQLPDAEIVNYGINYYQVVDSENYSLEAAFKQSEIQGQTGGSWIRNFFYSHVEMSRGARLIPGSDPGAANALPEIKNSKLNSLGASYGYGKIWVDEGFFFSAQGLAGAALQYQVISGDQVSDHTNINLAWKLNINSAFGRNLVDHAYGVRFLLDTLLSDVDSVQVYSTLASLQFFFGKRF